MILKIYAFRSFYFKDNWNLFGKFQVQIFVFVFILLAYKIHHGSYGVLQSCLVWDEVNEERKVKNKMAGGDSNNFGVNILQSDE